MKNVIRYIVVGILLVGIIVSYYYYLSHRKTNSAQEQKVPEVTEVQKVLERDLDTNYPATPRETLKFYNRILGCFYNEEHTDEEVEALAQQARMLMDDELCEANPYSQYFANLKKEIAQYAELKKTIVNSTVSDSNDIVFKKVNGRECAYVEAYYFCKEGSDYTRTYEEYVLRKDEQGRWRILAFRLTEPAED